MHISQCLKKTIFLFIINHFRKKTVKIGLLEQEERTKHWVRWQSQPWKCGSARNAYPFQMRISWECGSSYNTDQLGMWITSECWSTRSADQLRMLESIDWLKLLMISEKFLFLNQSCWLFGDRSIIDYKLIRFVWHPFIFFGP